MVTNNKQVVIRADASALMGAGHVQRCLTLADRFAGDGFNVCFLVRDLPGNLNAYICERGFKVEQLPFDEKASITNPDDEYSRWLQEDLDVETQQSKAVIARLQPALLIVDHYSLGIEWHSKMRPYVDKILVIDDLQNREFDCDVLLDQNFYIDIGRGYKHLVPKHCKILLGPKYALLQPHFLEMRRQRELAGKFESTDIHRVLLFMGGADPFNVTSRVIRALSTIDQWNGVVDVVVGSGSPYKEEIEGLCQKNERFNYHLQPKYYHDLMVAADLAIGAGGTSNWERCCIGLPAILIAIANNQVNSCQNLAKAGIVSYCGFADALTDDELRTAIRGYLTSIKAVKEQMTKGASLVDGVGADRVMQEVLFE